MLAFVAYLCGMTAPYLDRLGIESLNPMQKQMLETFRPGSGVVLIAPTGSGKTLAFLLPLLQMLDAYSTGIQALVIVPSRELALQIERVFREMQTGFKVLSCYGGHPVKSERNSLSSGPALVIGTPGRLADHMRRGHIETAGIKRLVLDEFDKSLELGFSDDMAFIASCLSSVDTRALTSATRMPEIPEYAGIKNPIKVDYSPEKSLPALTLHAVRADGNDKLEELFKLICMFGSESSLIFCNHREAVERISQRLKMQGIVHGIYHGGMEQEARELALIRFRNGTHHTLLTTNLASRGLDIPELRHVVHYQLPDTETTWIHRNGRTARMFASGKAWLVMAADEYVPQFLTAVPAFEILPEPSDLPQLPEWETLRFNLGKKDKVSRADIAGFLMGQGLIEATAIGRIDLADRVSYAAVKRSICRALLSQIRGKPLKRKQVTVALAR